MPKGWSPEFEKSVEEYFLSHSIGLHELAHKSLSLFGEKFSPEDIKFYSNRGKWSLKKTGSTEGNGISLEIETIRKVLFRQIVSMSEGGLIVSGEEEVIEALRIELESRGLTVNLVAPDGVEPSLVNSYMNLLSKANFDLGKAASKKTSQQKALEMLRESREAND